MKKNKTYCSEEKICKRENKKTPNVLERKKGNQTNDSFVDTSLVGSHYSVTLEVC